LCHSTPTLTSTGSQLYITFVSDNNTVGTGFRATYTVQSPRYGGIISGDSGSLTSPNYPADYPDEADCIWSIHTTAGTVILLRFDAFDVEYEPFCEYDAVEVYDGDQDSSLLGM